MANRIEDLFKLFAEFSGLSDSCVKNELEAYLEKLNIDRLNITEEDLRRVMSLYLEDFNCSFSEHHDFLENPSDVQA